MKNHHTSLGRKVRAGLSVAGVAACLGLASSGAGATFSLGGVGGYAVFGVGGSVAIESDFEVYQHDTVVNGNVGVGRYTDITHDFDGTINGRLDYDPAVTYKGGSLAGGFPPGAITGTITGGTHSMDLTGAQADARSASSYYAGRTATQIFSTLTENQVIVGNGGLNVIRITGDVTLKKGLTLRGGANDVFVFQLTASDATSVHELTLSGMTMTLDGVNAANILWDMNGTGGGVVISSGAVVYALSSRRTGIFWRTTATFSDN